jgi:hypothetical protein
MIMICFSVVAFVVFPTRPIKAIEYDELVQFVIYVYKKRGFPNLHAK